VDKGILLKPKYLFRRTLFQLTAQYAVLLFLLFSIFSGAVYLFADHTYGGDYPSGSRATDYEISDTALDRLRNVLLLSDASLVIVLPIISYWLARRALSPIQKSYEEQQRFVDDASHELRTPLSIVQGELELAVQKQRSPKEYVTAIQTSLKEVNGLNNLVADLLLIASGSESNIERTFVQIQLNTVVQDCVHSYQQIYRAKRLDFQWEIQEQAIHGSPELIYRCVANILDNACKYSKPGGSIDIALDKKDDFVSLKITDHGTGMSPGELKSAYTRFWRADEARAVKGHGLGLSIVKQIVELHHGKTDIISVKHSGTSVTILLPS
jgi:signal transduction histidine kinase